MIRCLACALVLVLTAACSSDNRDPAPAPESSDSTSRPPQPPVDAPAGAEAGAGAVAQAPPTRWDVDWSSIEKEPWVSILGNWDEVVDARLTCLRVSPDASAAARCTDLVRMLEYGVEEAEITSAVQAANDALGRLPALWSALFASGGLRFDVPSINFYGRQQQAGGALFSPRLPPACQRPLENAVYCPADNSIHFDELFLAKVQQAVRKGNGTDGRYAVAAVAAHEFGHAASIQTGLGGGDRPVEELIADCLAGASIAALARANASGSQVLQLVRELTPLAEGQLGVYLLGGPEARGAYEAGSVRLEFYTRGFNAGVTSCHPSTFRRTR